MVKFNPGLSQILIKQGFLVQERNSSLENSVVPLLQKGEMITKCYFKAMHRKVNTKSGTKLFESWISANRLLRNRTLVTSPDALP